MSASRDKTLALFLHELEKDKLKLMEDVIENVNLSIEQLRLYQGTYQGLRKAREIFEGILDVESAEEKP